MSDIRYALRGFVRQPSFALAAVATLALGIAVNTIAFSLLNSLALRPMPIRDASRVVRIYPVDANGRRGNLFSYPDFVDYRASSPAFAAMAAYIPAEVTAGRSSLDRSVAPPRAMLGYVVTASYFEVTGLRAVLGRVIQPADERAAAGVAVLSYAFWRSRFDGDAVIVGATLSINGTPFTVVGVAEPRFAGTEPLVADVWLPATSLNVAVPDAPRLDKRTSGAFLVVGRLADGVTRAGAADALSVVARRLAAAYPDPFRATTVDIARGAFFTLDPGLKPIIAGMMTVVGLVLLIACANAANLMLARAASRQREIAVRLAIGAGRRRIVRQLIVESLLLSVAAGGVALLLAVWALRALYGIGIGLLPFSWALSLDLAPDIRVFTYTLGLAAAGGVLLALAPALQLTSPRIVPALNGQGSIAGGRLRGSSLRHGLVVVQIAASVVLLFGAGLLLRALQSAQALDLGFTPAGVVYADYDVRAAGYTAQRAAAFNAALAETARQLPGVTAAGLTSHVPLHGGVRRINVRLGGRDIQAVVSVSTVTPEYFDIVRVAFVDGRNFSADELSGSQPAVIVSEGLARRFWPGRSALGQTVTSARWPAPRAVVGVVRDASTTAIWRDKEMAIYAPVQAADDATDARLILRTRGDEALAARALAARAAQLDPDLRFQASPVSRLLRTWMLPSQAAAASAALLAALALALASIGLYGVLSFSVGQRLRELGIRMALGADSAAVVALVLRDGWTLVWRGVAIGVGVALLTAPLLGRLLFGVRPFDPIALASVGLVLAVVAFAASYVPARRASRLEPVAILRVD